MGKFVIEICSELMAQSVRCDPKGFSADARCPYDIRKAIKRLLQRAPRDPDMARTAAGAGAGTFERCPLEFIADGCKADTSSFGAAFDAQEGQIALFVAGASWQGIGGNLGQPRIEHDSFLTTQAESKHYFQLQPNVRVDTGNGVDHTPGVDARRGPAEVAQGYRAPGHQRGVFDVSRRCQDETGLADPSAEYPQKAELLLDIRSAKRLRWRSYILEADARASEFAQQAWIRRPVTYEVLDMSTAQVGGIILETHRTEEMKNAKEAFGALLPCPVRDGLAALCMEAVMLVDQRLQCPFPVDVAGFDPLWPRTC